MTLTDHDQSERTSGQVHGTVEFLMRRMRHRGDLPAFSEHIAEINGKLSSLTAINYSSVGDLAKIILKDFTLTNKLLRVVNSALYSTLSGKVMTISKAVFLLGFDKVRMISAALMVFEHLQDKTQAAELKEVAVSSFMSGVIAMSVAENLKHTEKEEAFICAMLHNLGKMLVICYLPEEYTEVKRRMTAGRSDEDTASKIVLGVSYSELGMAVSRSWNFPDKIIRSMEYPLPGAAEAPKTEHELLRDISHYSNDLLDALMDSGKTSRKEVLSELSRRYCHSIHLAEEKMETIIDEAVAKIDDYPFVVRSERTIDTFKKRLTEARKEPSNDYEDSVHAPGNRPEYTGTERQDACKQGPKDERLTGIVTSGIQEIAEVIKSGRNLNEVIYMIIETMYRGFEFTHVLFCIRDVTKGRMVARFGLGENADELVRHFHFRVERAPDIFNIAISQAKGIIIDDAATASISRNMPPWYKDSIAAPSFLIYPLLYRGECIGMFYADRKDKGILLTEGQRSCMEELRGLAVQAITQKRG